MEIAKALPAGMLLSDRYRILQILGQGGMSRVYLADDTRLNTRVAVKENLQTSSAAQTQIPPGGTDPGPSLPSQPAPGDGPLCGHRHGTAISGVNNWVGPTARSVGPHTTNWGSPMTAGWIVNMV